MTDQIPDVVRTTIKALRTAATWLPDEQRDMLYEAATVAENGGWEDACCPICEETWCDAGCPLEDFRNELMRRPNGERDALRGYAEAKQSAAGSLRTMSGLLQEGSPMEAALGDLAGCLAERLDTPSPIDALWPQRLPLAKPIPTVWDGPHQPAVLPGACYDASFGRVHVRPGCRC